MKLVMLVCIGLVLLIFPLSILFASLQAVVNRDWRGLVYLMLIVLLLVWSGLYVSLLNEWQTELYLWMDSI